MARTWIAVTEENEIYRSVNDGVDWSLAGTAPATSFGFTTSLATDQAGVWCVGDNASNIWRSTDDGVTWAVIKDTEGSMIHSIATDKAGVWCSSDDFGQIFRSTNNGASWAAIVSTATLDCMATDGAGVWCGGAVGEGKLFRSSDNGASWGTADTLNDGTERFPQSIATDGAGTWYAGCYPGGQMWTSANDGVDWTMAYDSPKAYPFGLATDGGTVWCAGMNDATIYRSIDSGANWTLNSDVDAEYRIYAVATDKGGVWCAATSTDGKIYRSSDNGASWSLTYTCPGSSAVYDIAAGGESVTCWLLSIERHSDMSDYISRVYPRATDVTLANTTRTNTGDYVLDAAAGYIRNSASETSFGRRDRVEPFELEMISTTTDASAQTIYASNALFDKTLEWLGQHDSIADFYTIEVTGLTSIFRAGDSIAVNITTKLDGVTVETINRSFNVISVNNRLEDGAVLIATMELSTIERSAMNEASVMADAYVSAQRVKAGIGASVNISTTSVDGMTNDQHTALAYGYPHHDPKPALSVKTAPYTITTGDEVVVCNSGTAITITLPSATGSKKPYEVNNVAAGAVSVACNGTQVINGQDTQVVYQWESMRVIDYVANAWTIL